MRDEGKPTDAASDQWSSAEWREDLLSAAAFLTRLPVAQNLSGSFDLSGDEDLAALGRRLRRQQLTA